MDLDAKRPCQPKTSIAAVLGGTLLILVLFFSGQIVVANIVSDWLEVANNTSANQSELKALIMTCAIIGGGIIGILSTVVVASKCQLRLVSDLGFLKVRASLTIYFVVAAVIFNVLILYFTKKTGWQSGQIMSEFLQIGASSLLTWCAVVVIAPLFEELLFRGYMFHTLESTVTGTVGAIVIPNAVWMLMHISQYTLFGLLLIFAAGLLFSWARWKTGSIITSLLMHSAFNAAALIANLGGTAN